MWERSNRLREWRPRGAAAIRAVAIHDSAITVKNIFLDIDGVLVNRYCLTPQARRLCTAGDIHTPFDPACVAQLNRIIGSTGAEVVMSSSWRLDFEVSEMRRFLFMRGILRPLLDFTPRLAVDERGLAQPRGKEIQSWLASRTTQPDAFVILDDDDDMDELTPYLVRTDFERGLTHEDADRAIALLARSV
jgi:hypothetical protein